MTSGSSKKVWWICPKCGNEWQAVISSRTNGCGCPKCGIEKRVEKSKQPKQGHSLMDVKPELALEWNIEKNAMTCNEIAALSSQIVWWKCSEGHEWKASVRNRVRGRNCPYCGNKKIIAGYNDFLTIYPNVAEEWNYDKNKTLLPTQVAPSSSKKVWWRCKTCGHEWMSTINNRIKRGCPNCSKSRIVSFPEKAIFFYMRKIYQDVWENYRPDFLEGTELDIFIPQIKVAIEYDGELYHQDVERDIVKIDKCKSKGIMLIRVREPGCPKLEYAGVIIELESRDINSFEKMIRDIINILVVKNLLENITLDIDLKRDAKEVNALVNYQNIDKSIKITNPELTAFWDTEKNDDFTMEKVTYASDKEVWWKCPECNYEWFDKIYSMTRKKGKNLCPKCTKARKSLAGATPRLIPYWNVDKNNDIKMDEVMPTSQKEVWWKCPICNQEWKKKIYLMSDKRRKTICPYCKDGEKN